MSRIEEIDYCVNVCQGLEQDCEKYSGKKEEGEVCDWFKTFTLEGRMKEIDEQQAIDRIEGLIERQYDKDSAFIYDSKDGSLMKRGKIIESYKVLPPQWKKFSNVYEM